MIIFAGQVNDTRLIMNCIPVHDCAFSTSLLIKVPYRNVSLHAGGSKNPPARVLSVQVEERRASDDEACSYR